MRLRGRLVCETEGCGFTSAVGSPAELARSLRKHFHSSGHMVTVTLEKKVPDEMPVGITVIWLRAEIGTRVARAKDWEVSMHFLHSWSRPDDPVRFDWPGRL